MSVLYVIDHTMTWWITDAPPWSCQECARPVDLPCVIWQGLQTLLLHPACAARLGPHLIADAREATLAADPGLHWRRRLIAGLRHRLEREEAVA